MANNSNPKDQSKLFISVIVILSGILILFIISGITVLAVSSSNKKLLESTNIYNNIYIAGINVSNMSKEQTEEALSTISLDEYITITYKDKAYSFKKSDFGVTYDISSAIDYAYNIGREGSKKERIEEIKNLNKNSQNLILEKNIDEEIARAKLQSIADEINTPFKNATITKTSDGFNVSDGNIGIQVDFEQTYEELINALKINKNSSLEILANEVKPEYTSEDLNKIQDNLGSFSTNYTASKNQEGRITNIKIASERIDGTILYPGEIFSTNEKFGETTKENGYQPAPTILEGKLVDDYGGGVCQVSSTLYNAVLYSELTVVERQNHSLKVGYLDYGYDATLAGNYIDFKFKNSTQYPIYIESYMTENEVICNIYGYDERPENRTIKFESTLVEVVEPGPKVITNTDKLPLGQEQVEQTSLKGYKYKLYKLIYEDGNLVEKVFINNSYYKPRAEQVLVGTNTSMLAST